VGVRRAVVQDLPGAAGTGPPELAVEVLVAPPGLDLRLADRQVRLHVEPGRGEIERLFIRLAIYRHVSINSKIAEVSGARGAVPAHRGGSDGASSSPSTPGPRSSERL